MEASTEVVACPVCNAEGAPEIWREDDWRLVRCAECDLVYVANPPDDEALARLYSFEEGFHTQLSNDPHANEHVERQARRYLAAMRATQPPGRLLDVGCATGRFLAIAQGDGWKVRGIELNDDTAAIARRAGLDVTTGTLDDLAEADGSFDAITMWDVVEHVPDPVGLLRSARRLLAPGGRLWLATPNVDGAFPRASLKVADRVGAWPHPEPPYHLSQFSERTIRNALARAGFPDVVVAHHRIPLSYTFGSARKVASDPKRLAYTAAFAPIALAGPWLRRGDTLLISARAA